MRERERFPKSIQGNLLFSGSGVSPFFRAALVALLSGRENSKWTRQVAVVGAKKNLKIVGIFSFPHTHILYCKVLSNSGNKCAYS